MRIRLHGTPDEIEQVIAQLGQFLDITGTSQLCHDRGPSRQARVYLQVDLASASQRSTVR